LTIPLPILLVIVVVGVGTTLLLVHLLGHTAPPRLDGPDAVRARLAADLGEPVEVPITLADDSSAALAVLPGGGVAVVRPLGDRLAVRILEPGAPLRVRPLEAGLELRLSDPGFPRLRLPLADAATRDSWLSTLEALKKGRSEAADGRA
jgi:hypothetical protein